MLRKLLCSEEPTYFLEGELVLSLLNEETHQRRATTRKSKKRKEVTSLCVWSYIFFIFFFLLSPFPSFGMTVVKAYKTWKRSERLWDWWMKGSLEGLGFQASLGRLPTKGENKQEVGTSLLSLFWTLCSPFLFFWIDSHIERERNRV